MFFDKNPFKKSFVIKKLIVKLILLLSACCVGFALVLFVTNKIGFLPKIQLFNFKNCSDYPNVEIPTDDSVQHGNNSNSSDLQKDSFNDINDFFAIPEYDRGMEITDLAYNQDDFLLVRLNSDVQLPSYYSLTNVSRSFPDNSGNIITKDYPLAALHPRMGFILMQKNDLSFSLLDADGTFLCDIPDGMNMISARDKDNNPVFTSDDGYFYYSTSENKFLPSDYDPIFDKHGIVFDFPTYYDSPTENVYRSHGKNKNSWGFVRDDGLQIVSGIYPFTYQFSQGYGVVKTKTDRLFFHDANGYTRFTNHTFYAATHDGIENLGFYTFNKGLMRVREIKYNWRGENTYEREYVINLAGDEFFIPKDYKIESYFDGVFLLSKDDKYGFFNYLGEWICQPIYTYASHFIEGLGVVGYKDGKKGVVDENGNFVVPIAFDEITQCSGGVMALYSKENGWYLLAKTKMAPSTDFLDDISTKSSFESYLNKTPFTPAYIADKSYYDITLQLFNNSKPTLDTLHTLMPFTVTYIADDVSYNRIVSSFEYWQMLSEY